MRLPVSYGGIGLPFRRTERGPINRDEEVHPIRRFELQLLDPDSGGWHTVLTAASAEALGVSARTLVWQTQRPARLVDPEGRVIHVVDPERARVSSPIAA